MLGDTPRPPPGSLLDLFFGSLVSGCAGTVMINVTPAEAGAQEGSLATEGLDQGECMRLWIPACAGMTRRVTLIYGTKYQIRG